jgi:hypothetical protein
MNLSNLSPSQLREAADIQEQIVDLQEKLATLLNGQSHPKRKISAAGIAAIKAAQKRRWAKAKA